MIDMLSGTNTTLLILSAGYLFFILRYHYLTRDREKTQSLIRYTWSVSIAAVAIFMSSFFFFLNDFDIIYKSSQRDLSIITRMLFASQLIIAYSALEWQKGRFIAPIAIVSGLLVFVYRTLS